MDKKRCRKVKIPTLPQTNDVVFRVGTVEFVAAVREEKRQRMLVIAFYERKNKQLRYVLYQKKEDYITLEFLPTEGKTVWRYSNLANLFQIKLWRDRCFEKLICLEETDEVKISKFIQKEQDGNVFHGLYFYQLGIMKSRLDTKNREIQRQNDRKMSQVPAIPKGFDSWRKTGPFQDAQYIYYKRKTKSIVEAYCTNCKKDILLTEKPKHNVTEVCPHCHSEVTYKAVGKATRIFDNRYASLLQRTSKGEIVLRLFFVSKYYGNHYRLPEDHCCEYARIFYTCKGELSGMYAYTFRPWSGKKMWFEAKGFDLSSFVFSMFGWMPNRFAAYADSRLYPQNLKKVIKGTWLQYSQIVNWAKQECFDVKNYVEAYAERPLIEYTEKMGFKQLTKDLLEKSDYEVKKTLNFQGKNITEIFQLPKQKIREIHQLDPGVDDIMFVQAGCPAERASLDWCRENATVGQLEDILKHMSFQKLTNYIKRCDPNGSFHSTRWKLQTYRDYLSMCQIAGYTLKGQVLFPPRLTEAHDNLIKLVKVIQNEKYDLIIKEQYEKANHLLYMERNGLLIRLPKNLKELIQEGDTLGHCIASYAQRIAESTTTVLFIRRVGKESEPYYTVEYLNGKILQCSGKSRASATEQITEFLEQWKYRMQGTKKAA